TRSNRTPAAELRDYAPPLYGRHYKTSLNNGTISGGRSLCWINVNNLTFVVPSSFFRQKY
ncbi:MAG: hypothetical protein ACYSRP_07890, partial [Planctomycetota bacterium]